MKIYLFPGQGAQVKGMGAGLFARFPDLTARADAILGYSIRTLCVDDPRGELGKTQFTQPALYVVNALAYFSKLEEGGPADILAGHSLGEFNALMAAGCFDFETGLALVKKRGELMAQASGGAMAAILNASSDHIAAVLAEHGLHKVYLANLNTPLQTVISGLREDVTRASPLFQMQGPIRVYPLATSGAFHSAYMAGAMEQFRDHLQQVRFAQPSIPVLANVSGQPYPLAPAAILDTLASQIANTVRWCDSMQYVMALAQARGATPQFIECGPGDVLTRMANMVRTQTPQEQLDLLATELARRAA
ncbi:MAG: ACP S-malonyltransferase [Gammaproteobacteria bacterium]